VIALLIRLARVSAMTELSEAIVSAPVVVLTGAGASVPLGKATTEGFVERVAGLPLDQELLGIFRQVAAACAPSEGVQTVDIEVVLDHLARCIESGDALRRDPNFRAVLFGRNPPQMDIERLLKQYRDLREALLDEVVRHYGEVDGAAAARLYKPILVDVPQGLKAAALPVFTLNYDLAVEGAVDRLPVRLVDGLDRRRAVNRTWSAAQFHKVRASRSTTVALFKLHGSVSWCRDENGVISEVVGLHRDPPPCKHVLLYPSLRGKNLQGEPWSTAYGYLRACLGRAKVALIIGTSLRDAELVDALIAALAANPALRLVFVGPSSNHEEWARRVGVKPARVTAFAYRFGDKGLGGSIVSVVGALATDPMARGGQMVALHLGRARLRRSATAQGASDRPPISPAAAAP